MSRIKQKFIRFGTGTDDVNARLIPANYTAVNYTPSQVASEGADKVSAYLKGIDNAIGSIGSTTGDISLSTFSAANNQASLANVTGLAFSNGVVRSFDAIVSVAIDATTDLFAEYKLHGIQKSSDWELSYEYLGDDTGVGFDITSSGQVQYISSNISGFVSNTVKFRAYITSV